MDRKEISRRILDLTLEIISLLSGEEYTIVKKTSGDCVTPIIHLQESGGRSRTPHPITEPHPLIHEQKILKLTHKMMELLTGEVPIRCQDVTVYFSMEEWEYIEGHQDLYKEAMMEEHQPLISQAESSHKNSEGNLMLDDEDIMQRPSGENLNVHPGLHSTDLSDSHPDHEESSDQSQIATTSAGQKGGKRFPEITKRSNLFTDRQIYTCEKPFSCTKCGKYFAYRSRLVNHQRSHTGEKPYSCSECGKHFTHKPNLNSHLRSHTGEKPYSCSECGKRFSRNTHLVSHQRSHTREKPYSCSECEQRFTQKSDLVSHERSHRLRSQFQKLEFDFDSN